MPFSKSIKPLCLPTETTDTYAKEIATTVGWGVKETGDPSNVLREVTFCLSIYVYNRRAIISRGLYILYFVVEGHFFVFKDFFLENSLSMYG